MHGQFSDGHTGHLQDVGRERPLEVPKTLIIILVLVHFGLRKLKTKETTNLYSNTPTLLSPAGPVPHAEPIPASLVVILSTLVSCSLFQQLQV